MVEVTLIDALGPFIKVMGGFAGLTIAYFLLTLWQGKRRLQRLERIEREQVLARERLLQVLRMQRTIMVSLDRSPRKVRR